MWFGLRIAPLWLLSKATLIEKNFSFHVYKRKSKIKAGRWLSFQLNSVSHWIIPFVIQIYEGVWLLFTADEEVFTRNQICNYLLFRVKQTSNQFKFSMIRLLRVRFPGSGSYVGWVCCWLVLVPAPRDFFWVLRFSRPLKNQYFEIPIRSGECLHTAKRAYDHLVMEFSVIQMFILFLR